MALHQVFALTWWGASVCWVPSAGHQFKKQPWTSTCAQAVPTAGIASYHHVRTATPQWEVKTKTFVVNLYQLLPSHVSLLHELSQNPSLFFCSVYLQATVLFNCSITITSLLCSGILLMTWSKQFSHSVVLCANLSYFSSPSTSPSSFFHLRLDPRTWTGGCMIWALLNESIWTSCRCSQHMAYLYAYAQWLLVNYEARLQCQSTAASEPIPAFIYNYTHRWIVSEQPSLTN